MSFVPKDKFDEDACGKLFLTSDKEVILALPELLEWLQDYNWPVASKVT